MTHQRYHPGSALGCTPVGQWHRRRWCSPSWGQRRCNGMDDGFTTATAPQAHQGQFRCGLGIAFAAGAACRSLVGWAPQQSGLLQGPGADRRTPGAERFFTKRRPQLNPALKGLSSQHGGISARPRPCWSASAPRCFSSATAGQHQRHQRGRKFTRWFSRSMSEALRRWSLYLLEIRIHHLTSSKMRPSGDVRAPACAGNRCHPGVHGVPAPPGLRQAGRRAGHAPAAMAVTG